MPAQLLPIFPLSFVLLPGMAVPLHIFEERYKQMLRDIGETAAEFGIVLARDEGILNIGCTARVERIVNRYEDGRVDLIAAGMRRFQIKSLNQERSYLRAEVEFFDDEDLSEPKAELTRRALAAYRELLNLENAGEPEAHMPRLSFQMAQLIRDLDKRQTVLALRSETERLEFLLQMLPGYIVRQQRTALAKQLAPQNGNARAL
jgi:Lon protease-like protein